MKRIIVGLLILCPGALFAQTNFTIKGKISGPMSTLKKVYVDYYNGENYPPGDSVEIKNGEFEISGTMKDDEYNTAHLIIADDRMRAKSDSRITLFPKRGDHITIDVQGDIHQTTITGSKQSELYRLVQDSLSHSKSVDEHLVILKRLIEQYPDSKMALTVFMDCFNVNLKSSNYDRLTEVFKLYDVFTPRIRSIKKATTYRESLENISHIVIGGTLSDFTSKTTDGKVVKLSDFRGKYVLVDFWASWCIPCRAEFPYLKKAYARFKSKNVEILGYSIDNDRSLWVSALENDDVPWLNVSNLIGARDPIALTYQIHAVPSNFLIGPDGKVIAINLRGELLEPTLEKFIK
jgi:peroxiredoxin